MRLFLEAEEIVGKSFGSDSEPDAEDDAREKCGESFALCCCNLCVIKSAGSGYVGVLVGDIEIDIVVMQASGLLEGGCCCPSRNVT